MMPAATIVDVPSHPATCPLCHTVATEMTAADLASGRGWRCRTCDQRWDAPRLATVAAYARYEASRLGPVLGPVTT
jgi:hypothetical protein